MKKIFFYKRIDFWAQIMAFAIPLVTFLVTGDIGFLALAYFTVGGVQLLSIILNRLFLPKLIRTSTRIILEIATATIVSLALVTLIVSITVFWPHRDSHAFYRCYNGGVVLY